MTVAIAGFSHSPAAPPDADKFALSRRDTQTRSFWPRPQPRPPREAMMASRQGGEISRLRACMH
jgi:hypothetical protein